MRNVKKDDEETQEPSSKRKKERSEIKLYNDDVKSYIIFLGLRFKIIKKSLCNFYVRFFYVFSFNICNRRVEWY